MTDIVHKKVNWSDGMLVEAVHLKDSDKYSYQLASWVASNLVGAFGIIASPAERDGGLKCRLEYRYSSCFFIVEKCKAILPSGDFISYASEGHGHAVEFELKPELSYPLELCIHLELEEEVHFGEPNVEESQARYPYVMPKLTIRPLSGRTNTSLPICTIEMRQNEYALSVSYFPPVVHVHAYRPLSEYVSQITRVIETTRDGCEKLLTSMEREVQVNRKLELFSLHNALFDLARGVWQSADHILPALLKIPNRLTLEELLKQFCSLFIPVNFCLEIYPRFREVVMSKFITGRSSDADQDAWLSSCKRLARHTFKDDNFNNDIHMIAENLRRLESMVRFFVENQSQLRQSIEIKTVRGLQFHKCLGGKSIVSSDFDQHRITITDLSIKNVRDVVVTLKKSLISDKQFEYLTPYVGLNDDDAIATMEPCEFVQDPDDSNMIEIRSHQPLEAESMERLTVIIIGDEDPKMLSRLDLGSGDLKIYVRS